MASGPVNSGSFSEDASDAPEKKVPFMSEMDDPGIEVRDEAERDGKKSRSS